MAGDTGVPGCKHQFHAAGDDQGPRLGALGVRKQSLLRAQEVTTPRQTERARKLDLAPGLVRPSSTRLGHRRAEPTSPRADIGKRQDDHKKGADSRATSSPDPLAASSQSVEPQTI